jgi:hypothetical protein
VAIAFIVFVLLFIPSPITLISYPYVWDSVTLSPMVPTGGGQQSDHHAALLSVRPSPLGLAALALMDRVLLQLQFPIITQDLTIQGCVQV